MPLPAVNSPEWLTNLAYVVGGLGTFAGVTLAAFVAKQKEAKSEYKPSSGVTVVGGNLLDTRTIERLTDAIRDAERSVHSMEQAVRDNTRENERGTEALADFRIVVVDRNRQAAIEAKEEARIALALERLRAKEARQ